VKTITKSNKENGTNLCKSAYPFTLNTICSSRNLNSKADTSEAEMNLEFVATTIKK